MSLVLLGEGEVFHRGRRMSGAEGLKIAGLAADHAGAEGRAGAVERHAGLDRLGLEGLFVAEDLFAAAMVAGALVGRGRAGQPRALRRPAARRARPAGQIAAAAAYRHLLGESSEIGHSHEPLREGAGPLFAPLPAAGDGRVPDANPQRRPTSC